MAKNTVILMLKTLCLLITPTIIIGAVVLKKITLPTFVEKLESLISLKEAIYLENFLQETIPTSLIEKIKSLIQFKKINIFSKEVLTDLILERTLWEGLIVLTLTLTILVVAGLTLRSGCCLLLAVTLGLTVSSIAILVIILYGVIESVKLESVKLELAKLELAKYHRDPSAWYWKDHWLFNWFGKNQPVISPKFEKTQKELEKLLEKLELEKLELEKLLEKLPEMSYKVSYVAETIMSPNFTWGELTFTVIVGGLYGAVANFMVASALDAVFGDPIIKVFTILTVAPLVIGSSTASVISLITNVIMWPSKAFGRVFEETLENKLLEKVREVREVRETLETLKISQDELEKFLSKIPEMALEIYYITENIALNIALSDMTSGEITLTVLSSISLGAVIGVTIGVITNLVLIILFLTSLFANQVLVLIIKLLIRLVKVFGKVMFAGVKDLKFLLKGSIPGQLKIPKLKETFAFAGFSSLMIKFTSFLEKVNNTMLTTKVYLFIKNLSSFWQLHLLFVNLILFYIIIFILYHW